MLDCVIRGGTVIDGTGAPGRRADVAIQGGRIAAVGEVTDSAAKTIDAEGLMVAPGFVDPHTHYDALAAGGLGLSTSLSFTHIDADGQPVPSRWCDRETELIPLARTVGRHEGTTLELIIDGCITRFSDEEIDLMTRLSLEAQRPL